MFHNPSAHSVARSACAQTVDDHSFKLRDASSYDSMVGEFDRFTRLLTTPLADRLVSLAQPTPGERILDIGTGTGVVALKVAQRIGRQGNVVGIDLSDRMLATAAANAQRSGLKDLVEFQKMDAEVLALADGSFDAVVSLFALLHFPNPSAALKEMFRVLRPGGRLVVAIGSGAPLYSLTGLLHRARRLPEVWAHFRGKQLTAPAFLNSLVERHFPEPGEVEESRLAKHGLSRANAVIPLVRSAGFDGVGTYWQAHRALLESPEEYWEIQRTFSSFARKRLAATSAEEIAALKERFLRTCRRVQARGGQLVYPAAALYVTARRPTGA